MRSDNVENVKKSHMCTIYPIYAIFCTIQHSSRLFRTIQQYSSPFALFCTSHHNLTRFTNIWNFQDHSGLFITSFTIWHFLSLFNNTIQHCSALFTTIQRYSAPFACPPIKNSNQQLLKCSVSLFCTFQLYNSAP